MASTAVVGEAHGARTRRRRPPRLRNLAAATFITGAVLSTGVAIAWIASTHILHESVRTLVLDSQRNAELSGVEAALLRYNRVSNLLVGHPDPALRSQRREAFALMRAHLDAAERLSSSATDRAEVAVLRAEIRTYLEERNHLERTGAPLETIVQSTRNVLGAPLTGLGHMRREYGRALHDSAAHAATVSRNVTIAGVVAIAIVVLTMIALLLGVREWIVLPLRRLVRSLDELRESGPPAHALMEGPQEIQRIAQVLNQTTGALADQRKEQLAFMAGIAHDLRNPLSGLRITVDLVRELDPQLQASPTGGRALAVLDRNLDRVTRMVDDLLDSTRIQAGELALELDETHDLCDSARAAVELYGGTSQKHTLRLDVPEEPVHVCADPVRMDQVVGNLVSNAIKYAPDGGDVIVRVEKKDGQAVLAVRDQGVGIPREEQRAIFEPFRRSRQASDFAAGAGLGLSVVRRIVEAHGGHIELESSPGRGSEFRVVLPRRPDSNAAERKRPSSGTS